ncbi:phage virion morphogenesis family protein [Desulfosporosinus acididurans]|uniref:Phage virion morphogenesis family protein n=1 Tax=Desulfosporosinus acididurans TaxID=476652 RepID=A0A0J1FSN5_9FIRM|nr:phage virion morphogenesis protein [Desulfosporosinus acididurans]KLU66307.1 phage virion morphogenesis family protein [Desulfosporosinus acididurans]
MSNVEIKIEAKGIDTVQNVLESMAVRGVRLSPLMGRIGIALIASVHENFAMEGRPKWKPLSAKTAASYQASAVQKAQSTKRWQSAKKESTKRSIESSRVEKDVGGHKILVQSGELRQSIVLGEVTDSSVVIGSSLPYARIHQLGGTIGPITIKPKDKQALVIPTANGTIIRRSANIPERKIPARPYLAIQLEDIAVIERLTMAYIREGT